VNVTLGRVEGNRRERASLGVAPGYHGQE